MISMNPLHNHISNNYEGNNRVGKGEEQGIRKGMGSSKGNSGISVNRSSGINK